MKPLGATLGEVLTAKGDHPVNDASWRADLRSAGIPRRVPAPARPDRGYVEQPEERASPPTPRRALIPISELERVQFEELEEQTQQETAAKKAREEENFLRPPRIIAASSPPPRSALDELLAEYREEKTGTAATQQCAPSANPVKQREIEEMPKKKSKHPNGSAFSIEARLSAVQRVIAGPPGTAARLCKELGIHQSALSQWKQRYQAGKLGKPRGYKPELTADAAPTLISNGPPSGIQSVRAPLPPVPTVTLQGLEEYIHALVDRRVREQFKLRMAAAMGGD